MNQWFECKVRHEEMTDKGLYRKVTGLYLVDAVSFTEAEARITVEVTPRYPEFEVAGIKKARYDDVVFADEVAADTWYAVTLDFITMNEKTGKEEKSKAHYLLQASDLRDAMRRLDAFMKGTLADYSTACVKETAIVEVYPYGEATDS